MGPGSGPVCAIRLNSILSPADKVLYQNPLEVRWALQASKTVAVVGLSNDRQKPSYFVASYLKAKGYRIVPINPKADVILGEKVYRRLEDIPFPVDLVDIFRPAAESVQYVRQAIDIGARVFWQQLRIVNQEAASIARAAGLISIMDLCIKMEHGRYGGGLQSAGMNTEIISARRSLIPITKETQL